MEEDIDKWMKTNNIKGSLKELIDKEWERHNMIIDQPGRDRHYHYIVGLETAYDVVVNNYGQVGLKG